MDPIFRLLYHSEQFQKNSASNHAMMVLSENLDKVPEMTIEELADLCSTNPMTLSRIVRKLGYKSFADFRAATAETLSQYKYLNRNIPMSFVNNEKPSESFFDYLELKIKQLKQADIEKSINEVCDALHEASHIHFYGPPISSVFSIMMLHDLLVDKKTIHPYTSNESILADLEHVGKDSLIFVIPNEMSTDTNLVRTIIDVSEKKGAKLVLHTENGNPLLSFTKGPNLCYEGDSTAFSIFSSQFLINILTMTYRSRYID